MENQGSRSSYLLENVDILYFEILYFFGVFEIIWKMVSYDANDRTYTKRKKKIFFRYFFLKKECHMVRVTGQTR